ncbi:MAG: CPBP family intramembrane metalloprotease [Candidatus Omnitrophica bacterium]|nr:CPBP family intramembrane metalloprotease [Candidatus Omnitrophota bacterium]
MTYDKSSIPKGAIISLLCIVLVATLCNILDIPYRNYIFLFFCFTLPLIFNTDFQPSKPLRLTPSGWVTASLILVLITAVPLLLLLGVVKLFLGTLFLIPKFSMLKAMLLNGAALGFLIALPEEFFFRGYLQEQVLGERERRILPGISQKNVYTSLLFALTHATSYLNPYRITVFFGSLVLGYITEKARGSIWQAVLLHAYSNMMIAVLYEVIKYNIPGLWLG